MIPATPNRTNAAPPMMSQCESSSCFTRATYSILIVLYLQPDFDEAADGLGPAKEGLLAGGAIRRFAQLLAKTTARPTWTPFPVAGRPPDFFVTSFLADAMKT